MEQNTIKASIMCSDEASVTELNIQKEEIEESLYERIFKLDITLTEKMQMSEFADKIADLSDIIENLESKVYN